MLNNILYNFPLLAAFFWLLLILVSKHPSQPVIRKTLIIYMLDSALVFFAFAATMQQIDSIYIVTRPLLTLGLTSTFPLYYIYLRLNTNDTKFNKRYLWLFMPTIILCTALVITLNIMNPQELSISINYEHTANRSLLTTGPLRMIFYINIVAAVVMLAQVAFFSTASVMSVIRYRKTIEGYYSNSYERVRGVVIETALIVSVAILAAVLTFSAGRQLLFDNEFILILTSVLSSIPMFVVGFHAQRRKFTIQDMERESKKFDAAMKLKTDQNVFEPNHIHNDYIPETPHVDYTAQTQEATEKETQDKQTVEINIAYIAERIAEVIEKKQLFLKTDLRITDVCELLATNRTYISQAINNHLGGNFSDFINRYRLEYAKKLLSDRANDNYTIESLAEQAGFSTAASMNRTFRKIEGLTPHQWRQNSLKTIDN